MEWVNKANYYDVVFASKIFTFTEDYDYSGLKAGKIYKGGTGYDVTVKLPPEIDSYNRLDYSIYPDCDYSLQFFTRGCVNSCPFCIVRKKEGYLHPVKPVPLNRKGKWIDVLDNNFFASPDWKKHLEWLRKRNQPVNFRGVDVRILTDEQAKELNTLKIKNGICIAWDNPKQNLEPYLAHLITLIKPYKLRCYVLVGFNSTIKEDLHRIYTLQKYGILPYVMVYKDYEHPQEKTSY